MRLPKNLKKMIQDQPQLICVPPRGRGFVAYKAVCRLKQNGQLRRRGGCVVTAVLTLYIPPKAHRRNGKFREDKFRVSDAYVVAAHTKKGKPLPAKEKIFQASHTRYSWTLGKWHKPSHAFDRSKGQCESGLHGFLSLKSAREYFS